MVRERASLRHETRPTDCRSAAASAANDLQKPTILCAKRSAATAGSASRSPSHARHPSVPATPARYHAGITCFDLESRTPGITPCTTGVDREPRTSGITLAYNEPSAQRAFVPHLHNEPSAQRAFVLLLHNGLWHDGEGTTRVRDARFARSKTKKE